MNVKRWIVIGVLAAALVPACSKKSSPSKRQTSGDPPPGAVLAQTKDDAMTGNFDGKVLKSTHPKVAAGTRCEGSIARAKGSGTAQISVRCGDTTLYEGTGKYTFDPKDPTKRDDDRIEYDDEATSDQDKTPGCHMVGENGQADGTGGTLNVWDGAGSGQAAFEVVIAL